MLNSDKIKYTDKEFRYKCKIIPFEYYLKGVRLRYFARFMLYAPQYLKLLVTMEYQHTPFSWLEMIFGDLEWFRDSSPGLGKLADPRINFDGWRVYLEKYNAHFRSQIRVTIAKFAGNVDDCVSESLPVPITFEFVCEFCSEKFQTSDQKNGHIGAAHGFKSLARHYCYNT